LVSDISWVFPVFVCLRLIAIPQPAGRNGADAGTTLTEEQLANARSPLTSYCALEAT
jgi:hypothetical protein